MPRIERAESLYVGLNNLDKFAWIGAFSSAPMLWGPIVSDAGRGAGAAPSPPMDEAIFAKTFPSVRGSLCPHGDHEILQTEQ
jgi:hypothetical protein